MDLKDSVEGHFYGQDLGEYIKLVKPLAKFLVERRQEMTSKNLTVIQNLDTDVGYFTLEITLKPANPLKI